MLLRYGLLAFMALIAGAAIALAVPSPPIKSEVEGRESNPVAREYYEPERPMGKAAGQTILHPSKWDEQAAEESLVSLIGSVMDTIVTSLVLR
jgi:hypothetical protein